MKECTHNAMIEIGGAGDPNHVWKCADCGRVYGKGSMTLVPKRPHHMQCACCGKGTRGRQWYNRDTGYGVCPECYTEAVKREGEDRALNLYGYPGVHHSTEEEKPERDLRPFEAQVRCLECGATVTLKAAANDSAVRVVTAWIENGQRCQKCSKKEAGK